MKYEALEQNRFVLEQIRTAKRYETLRSVTPRQFAELYERNLRGEDFDQMVDELGWQMAK